MDNINMSKYVAEVDEETYAYADAVQIINSCTLPMVLNTAIEMGVLQLISNEAGLDGLSPKEIAARVQAHQNPDAPVMLDRMLRLLATYNILSCRVVPIADGGVERRYGLAGAIAKFFVADEDGVSLGPLLSLLIDPVFLKSWGKLKEAVLEGGIPFNKVHGMHAFIYPILDPRFNDVFNKAMYNHSVFIMQKILKRYNGFEKVQQLVDIGGGLGHSLRVIIAKYPHIKGINFDFAHVIKHAPPIHGVEHVSGDMFQSVPVGDTLFLKWILHDWSDNHCVKLLENCYKALPNNGKVIVVEANITEEVETTTYARAVSQMDVFMMTQNPGGKERTLKEFEVLAKRAGFTTMKIECFVYGFWVIEFYK